MKSFRIKSIFEKQLLLYIVTIFFSVMLVASSTATVYHRHYVDEIRNELVEQGKKIAQEYAKAYRTANIESFANLAYEFQVLEEYMGANIMLVNRDGVLVMTSPDVSEALRGKVIQEDMLQSVLEGNIVFWETNMDDAFDVPMLVVGYPISAGNMAGIFMCRSIPEIENSLMRMHTVGVICLILVMILGVVVSFFATRVMTSSILQMNDVAKQIANGNFDKRVEIRSEDELGELAKSFNQMAQSLEENEDTRKKFIADVSHDLRSPLTSIQGFLTAVMDGTVPPDKQNYYLNIALEESKRLSRLAESMVDMSRADASKLTLDWSDFDLNELIRTNIEALQPQLNEKNLIVEAELESHTSLVHGDKDKILRVIHNILENAVKFSPANGVIYIETTSRERGKILVSIRDQGPGISKEEQRHIFDRFYKADATRNLDMTGSGLGLSIVREIINAHGEQVSVKSKVGEGAEFVFTLQKAET